MTSRMKDFGGDAELNKEPLIFKLYGEEFECYPEMQGAHMLDFFEKVADVASASSIMEFFEKVMLPDDWKRFQNLTNDPERIIRIDKLGQIVTWLVEQYAGGIPTQPSRPSGTGRTRRGSGSTANS